MAVFSSVFRQAENTDYLKFDEKDPELQPLYAWKNQYLAQRGFDATCQLKDIKAPTLILSGEEDQFANPSDANILAQSIPSAKWEIMPFAGHLFNYESPDLFHQHVLNFLTVGSGN